MICQPLHIDLFYPNYYHCDIFQCYSIFHILLLPLNKNIMSPEK